MGRTAEKNKKIANALKEGSAESYVDAITGKRKVKLKAPNTEKKTVRRSFLGTRILYNCPKCGQLLLFRKKIHQGLCMNCGQRLDWSDFDDMGTVWIQVHDAEEAGYWAAQYEYFTGETYGIDTEKWRLSVTKLRDWPMLLYFAFPYGKDYGRFMRKAAKEATVVKIVNGGETIK